ncbi:MAG: glycosyltransferase [Steroidobacteraceae bacterium]
MAGTQILSIICVLDGRQLEPVPVLREVHRFAAAMSLPFELVIVVNGPTPQVGEEVRSLAHTLDSLQLYFMKRRVDYPTALLAGLENAIGDWVATLDPACDDPAVLRELVQSALRQHCEVAVAVPMGRLRRGPVEAVLSSAFHLVFRRLHGFSLALESPTARLLSRAVANDVLQHDSPLIALETLTAGGGYTRIAVPTVQRSPTRLPVAERLRVRWRTLLGINAAPLRIANLICAGGALAALAYSIYVIAIYIFKSDVRPGWTTVSLILSAMFLTFSLVLGMLSEYLIMLLDVGARRGRYEIAEELASTVQPRSKLLNVETQL